MFNRISPILLVLFSAYIYPMESPDFSLRKATKENIIEAAKENKEPCYIKDLMAALSIKIEECFNLEKPEHMPLDEFDNKKTITLWLTMRRCLNVAYNAADKATFHEEIYTTAPEYPGRRYFIEAGKASDYSACYQALDAVVNAIKDLTLSATWSQYCLVECFLNVSDLMPNTKLHGEIARIARDKVKDLTLEPVLIGKIIYMISEWASLKYMLKNFQSMFEDICINVFNLPDYIEIDQLDNYDNCDKFYKKHFSPLNLTAMRFLAPWLIHLLSIDFINSELQ